MLAKRNWSRLLSNLGVSAINVTQWAPLFEQVIHRDTFSAGEQELPLFLAQVLHESGNLSRLEESLNYQTPGRLMQVWPSRFKTLESETPYLRNPEALANKVYGGRMGNILPGDGWKYRGSGLIQLTGASNFKEVQRLTGIKVYDDPSLLRSATVHNLLVAISWWEHHIPDALLDDVTKVTKIVNGGIIGLAHRKQLTQKARILLA